MAKPLPPPCRAHHVAAPICLLETPQNIIPSCLSVPFKTLLAEPKTLHAILVGRVARHTSSSIEQPLEWVLSGL